MSVRMWVDVSPSEWYYNEVMEASNYLLEDGQPLVAGIPYAVFEDGKPYIYEEHKATPGKKVYTISKKITPTSANPLYVFIDGIQTMYKSVKPNAKDPNKTDVELYVAPKAGAIVSFASYGVPKVDPYFKKPVDKPYPGKLPNKLLQYGATYFYHPFSTAHQEYLYAFGRALKRANIRDDEWASGDEHEIAKKYIGYSNDTYAVNPLTGRIFLPYNLNGVTCRFIYWSLEDGELVQRGGYFQAFSDEMVYNNRFFPNALMTRAEAYALIDRLRKSFYSRFTDMDAPGASFVHVEYAYQGQRVFRLNGNYPAGEGKLIVLVDGKPKHKDIDYEEFDDNTVVMKYPLEKGQRFFATYSKFKSDRFKDIGVTATIKNGNTGKEITWTADLWFVQPILDMEGEKLNDGTYLISGMPIKYFDSTGTKPLVDNYNRPYWRGDVVKDPPEIWFMPMSALTRAEAVAFLNRFRKWCLERFK